MNQLKWISYAESMNQNMPLYLVFNKNNQRELMKSERNIRKFANNEQKDSELNLQKAEARTLKTANANSHNRKWNIVFSLNKVTYNPLSNFDINKDLAEVDYNTLDWNKNKNWQIIPQNYQAAQLYKTHFSPRNR